MFADRAGLEDLIAKALASVAVAELLAEMAGRNGPVRISLVRCPVEVLQLFNLAA